MWKLIMPIIGFFLFVLVGFSIFLPVTLSDNTESEAVASAINTSGQFKRLRDYYSSTIVRSVVYDGSPVISTTDHKNKLGAIPVPATFLHDVTKRMSSENVKFSFYSPFPFANRVGRKEDDFNRQAWDYLKENPKEAYSELFKQNGRQFMRVGVADIMSAQGCVNCHNNHPDSLKKDWNLGDVRGVLEMNIDLTEEKTADRNLSFIIIGTLILLLVMVVLVIAFSFSRFIQKRVKSITRAVDSVVEGDLTTELKYGDSQDELSVIMQSINRITNQYKETIELISDSANQLKEEATSFNDVTSKAKIGTQQQSNLSNETTNSMIEMLDTVTQVADRATKATKAARMTQQASVEGRKVVDYSVVAVETMSEQAEAATTIITQLQNNVEKIGTVSSVIGTIAGQTNLLALNAAIEAARAGEYGRGFAVVADEVRSLASKTMNSTGEIDDIISQLQETTLSMVEAMANNREQASFAVEQIQNTKRSLSDIGDHVDEITLVNNDIQSVTELQTKVADNVNVNISQIADISRDVEEGTKRISQNAVELNQVAQQMQDLCKRFKLK